MTKDSDKVGKTELNWNKMLLHIKNKPHLIDHFFTAMVTKGIDPINIKEISLEPNKILD